MNNPLIIKIPVYMLATNLSNLIPKTCSKEPDSLGDRIFNSKLKLSQVARNGGIDPKGYIKEALENLNEYYATVYKKDTGKFIQYKLED